jgi:predicted nucleic acid-binding protein
VTFVDTGAWVALFVEGDARHEAARAWINSNLDRLVTSDYIVDEVLTLITARYRRQTAIRAGHVLFSQELAGLIQLTEEDKERAWKIFRSHSDKRWSFTDCTSLALMQRLRISNAFAFDRHFSQMRGVRRVPN